MLLTKWDRSGTNIIDLHTYVDGSKFSSWRIKSLLFLKQFLPEENDFVKTISGVSINYYNNAEVCQKILGNVKEYYLKGFSDTKQEEDNSQDNLELIFSRFHKVARQLRSRYNGRKTLEIEDEYDTQDLLHALLQLYFNDIRAEEWTPSYAGGCARMDFLLKNEKIVIEVKKQGLV